MLQVQFEYLIKGQAIEVIASCKSIVDSQFVDGLSLAFLNDKDERILVPYDKDLFEDLENEAVVMLAEAYYNPELNFNRTH